MPRLRSFRLAMLLSGVLLSAAHASADQSERLFLHKNWQLQSSCEAKATGKQLSTPGFDASSWHHTNLPSTVVGALVNDKTYPDPTYGTNLRSLPGMDYSSKSFFALQDMPKDSPFLCSWWFRTDFTLPSGDDQKTKWLHFLGINYRANIWLNGQKIADAKDTAGTFETFEFNVSTLLRSDKPNALAVEISAPGKNDLGITWID
jgi:exo-1,4-beta-D-glucosaminidase